ncbi:hypothetical protein Pen01_06250 [Phytomonospora endophytica]|nr:hypothetical protein Pen01_06250 [Phytomonospora endophytica]
MPSYNGIVLDLPVPGVNEPFWRLAARIDNGEFQWRLVFPTKPAAAFCWRSRACAYKHGWLWHSAMGDDAVALLANLAWQIVDPRFPAGQD